MPCRAVPWVLLCGFIVLSPSSDASVGDAVVRVPGGQALGGGEHPIAQQAYFKASNAEAGDEFGFKVAVSGNTIAVAAREESSTSAGVDGSQSNNGAESSGAVYVFVRDGATWSQQAYLKASNPGAFDRFGWSIDLDGDTLVVGAAGEQSTATGVDGDPSNNSGDNVGAAYVFVRNGTTWSQQAYLKASNAQVEDYFGESVAISGDTIVVGAGSEDSNATGVNGAQDNNAASRSGAAYVFVRDGTTWNQQAYLKASNTGPGDDFGQHVDIDGDTIVVGALVELSAATGVNGDQSDNSLQAPGAAYVFVRDGTTWSQQAYLKASNTGFNDFFGGAVAVSGDTIAVGAYHEASSATGVDGNQSDNSAGFSGAVYVFVREGTTWSQQAYIKASNTNAGDNFARSVALDGDTMLVGAMTEASAAVGVHGSQLDNSLISAGAAYLFVRDGTSWSQQAYVKASNTSANSLFGWASALAGDTAVVGAYKEDAGGEDMGAAYVYDLQGMLPDTTLTLDVLKGLLVDSPKAGKDALRVKADLQFLFGVPDKTFAPASEELRLLIGPESAPFELIVPAGDAGWKSTPKKAPRKFTWKSAKGALPKVTVTLDTKKSKLIIQLKKAEWDAAPENPILIDLEMGLDAVELLAEWTEKKPGKFSAP